jgi:mono/diheme cytochrome c family protein
MSEPSEIGDGGGRMVRILLVGIVAAATGPLAAVLASPPTVDFRRQVRPILSDACYDCHGPDARARKARLRLDIPDGGVFEDRGGGPIVAPGKPGDSEPVRRITATEAGERMPPPGHNRQLTAAEIEVVSRWIAEGARWQGHWSLVAPGADGFTSGKGGFVAP